MRLRCPFCKESVTAEDFDEESNTYECPDCEVEFPAA